MVAVFVAAGSSRTSSAPSSVSALSLCIREADPGPVSLGLPVLSSRGLADGRHQQEMQRQAEREAGGFTLTVIFMMPICIKLLRLLPGPYPTSNNVAACVSFMPPSSSFLE